LRNALKDFKGFLDTNVPVIKPAIQSLKAIIPQITELLDKLIALMGQIKAEIQRLLSGGPIANLDKVTQFTQGITTLLTTAKTVIPNAAGDINAVLEVAQVAGSLPTVGQLKDEINGLIDAIVVHLNSLKA
jgi:phage-related protein